MQKLVRSAFTAVLAALGAVVPSGATVIPVQADATISATYPQTNFGGTANLVVDPSNQAVLQFSLGALPAGTTSAQISRALLIVYVNRVNTAGTVDLNGLSNTFNESALTYSSAPALSPSFLSAQTVGGSGYVTYDVTSNLQSLVGNSTTAGYALTSTGQASVLLDSKENDATAHAAFLDVTLVSQGPQGVPGPTGPNGTNGANGSNGTPGTNGTNGSTPWTSNFLFPAGTGTGSGQYLFAPVSGVGSAMIESAGAQVAEELQAPSPCTASGFRATTQATATAQTPIFLAHSSNGGQLQLLIGCTIPANGTACTSTATGSINAGDQLLLYLSAVGTEFANTHAFVTFVCQ